MCLSLSAHIQGFEDVLEDVVGKDGDDELTLVLSSVEDAERLLAVGSATLADVELKFAIVSITLVSFRDNPLFLFTRG